MKWLLIGCTSFVLNTALFANIGPRGFGEFSNQTFVETGSYLGEGIKKALDAGFNNIRSIEYMHHHVLYTKKRFINTPNVKIIHGDSRFDLWEIINDIDHPITFWLDAHIYPPRKDGGQNCPLLEELEQIKWHPIRTHTILIDDMHCCGTASFDYLTQDDLIAQILEINPAYQIRYIEGGDQGEYPNNIMIAEAP